MSKEKVKLVVFDLAGTTVDDNINGLPLVTVAMQEAFKNSGLEILPENVNEVRGMEKREAIRTLLGTNHCSLVEKIFTDFKIALDRNLNKLSHEISGTTEVFYELKRQDIKIAVGSGFPQKVVENIVEALNWTGKVDFISSAELEGHGRPHPCLIKSAMTKFGISDVWKVVKVGDTKLDIQEGKNAGCWTVAVLTGTQGEAKLAEEKPDFIIGSVVDLPGIIQQINCSC